MNKSNDEYINQLWERTEQKVRRMWEQIGTKSPHAAREDGIYDDRNIDWWTSGFWPGLLWIMYDMSGEAGYRESAWGWDERLEPYLLEPTEEVHHDVGFQFLCTAVIKYKLTGDTAARRRGLAAANYLAARFNPTGRYIRAWNYNIYGNAIIDSMMNVSLLFWASQETGDPRYKHMAVQHADTVLTYFIRPDGSVNHIVTFDPESGQFCEAKGGQGYGPNSSWSRGQAWAIAGMANVYRYTKDQRYLDTAKQVAHYFISQLPEDGVPFWDFRLPALEGEPRDSSAGAIAASGMLEIARLVVPEESRSYYAGAFRLIRALAEQCGTWEDEQHQAILRYATGNRPANHNVNGSLIYGDYYFVEALAKWKGWSHRIF